MNFKFILTLLLCLLPAVSFCADEAKGASVKEPVSFWLKGLAGILGFGAGYRVGQSETLVPKDPLTVASMVAGVGSTALAYVSRRQLRPLFAAQNALEKSKADVQSDDDFEADRDLSGGKGKNSDNWKGFIAREKTRVKTFFGKMTQEEREGFVGKGSEAAKTGQLNDKILTSRFAQEFLEKQKDQSTIIKPNTFYPLPLPPMLRRIYRIYFMPNTFSNKAYKKSCRTRSSYWKNIRI